MKNMSPVKFWRLIELLAQENLRQQELFHSEPCCCQTEHH